MSNWQHLDASARPRPQSVCPAGWHVVSLRSIHLLKLMGKQRPDMMDHQVVSYTVNHTRQEAAMVILQLEHDHFARTNAGFQYYLGRSILCADLFFEEARDAVLFKLSLT